MNSPTVEVRKGRFAQREANRAKEPAPPSIKEIGFSGSKGQCVRIRFTQGLCYRQQAYVEKRLRTHECYSYVHELRWARGNRTLVIEVKIRSLRDCSRVDVEKAIRAVMPDIPIFPR